MKRLFFVLWCSSTLFSSDFRIVPAVFTVLSDVSFSVFASWCASRLVGRVVPAVLPEVSSEVLAVSRARVVPVAGAVAATFLMPFQRGIFDFWQLIVSGQRLSPQVAEAALREVLVYAHCVVIINKIAEEFKAVMGSLHEYQEVGPVPEIADRALDRIAHFSGVIREWGMSEVASLDRVTHMLQRRISDGLNIDDVLETLEKTMASLLAYWRGLAKDQKKKVDYSLKRCHHLLWLERFVMYVCGRSLSADVTLPSVA